MKSKFTKLSPRQHPENAASNRITTYPCPTVPDLWAFQVRFFLGEHWWSWDNPSDLVITQIGGRWTEPLKRSLGRTNDEFSGWFPGFMGDFHGIFLSWDDFYKNFLWNPLSRWSSSFLSWVEILPFWIWMTGDRDTPPKTNMSPRRGLFLIGNTSSNHWFY